MRERNAYRGQIVSLGGSTFGMDESPVVTMHARPDVPREAIVLGEGVLERVERHVLEIGRHRERLRRGGRHLKRGLLLHGPPGTGKTLTVTYLMGRLRETTVLLLSGQGLGLIGPSTALARSLQPALVVLEDVDLVAEERTLYGGGSPLLFELLNEMDGLGGDADVAFLLTTNRADLLEPALAARPGRIDQAVEIALPDAEGRRRLLELYGAGLDLRLRDVGSVVSRTDGVSPAFVKELLRKAALTALEEEGADRDAGADERAILVEDRHVHAALDELLAAGAVLTRVLLGGASEAERRRRPDPGADPFEQDFGF
jgi:ATP-dependent 26S proteasome regulatory subunit